MWASNPEGLRIQDLQSLHPELDVCSTYASLAHVVSVLQATAELLLEDAVNNLLDEAHALQEEYLKLHDMSSQEEEVGTDPYACRVVTSAMWCCHIMLACVWSHKISSRCHFGVVLFIADSMSHGSQRTSRVCEHT